MKDKFLFVLFCCLVWVLFGLFFFVVYWEVFEMVLFFLVFVVEGSSGVLLVGFVIGIVILGIIIWVLLCISICMFIGKFFVVSFVLVVVFVVVFVGKGVVGL